MKNSAIREAKIQCFRNLWFFPYGNLVYVSDPAWVAATKKYRVTVKAALVVSPLISYFAVGILVLLGSWVVYSGELGIITGRLPSLFGSYPIRLLVVAISAYVSSICLFYGTLRLFLLGTEK
jgi:hypothetical protein